MSSKATEQHEYHTVLPRRPGRTEGKPRNNFARLPFDIRRRVIRLLLDGATYDDVRVDAEVARACKDRNLALHGTTFQAIVRSDEYRRYRDALEQTTRQVAADRWAADALRDCAGIESVADVTQMELLRQLRDLAMGEEPVAPGDLLKLSTAITRIKASTDADRENRLKETVKQRDAEIQELKAAIATLEAEKAAMIARIEQLKEIAGQVDGATVAEAMKQKFGV